MGARPEIALFIDPVSHHFLRDALFDTGSEPPTGDNILAPYVHLRDWFGDRGVPVFTADRLMRGESPAATNVYVSMGIQENYSELAQRPDVILSAFFALECPIVEPSLYRGLARVEKYFHRVFTFSGSAPLARFLRRPLNSRQFHIPQSFDGVHEDIWSNEDRGFLVMINANKRPRVYWRELYTERLRAIEYFGRTGAIDLYGIGWDGPPLRVGKSWVPWTVRRWQERLAHGWQKVCPDPLLAAARRAFRGKAISKAQTLGRYTFALCFENMILEGWITEKIFDCFFAGTVPVYWGAPDIERYVPPSCYIDMRQFRGYDELAQHLQSLTVADVRAYKENARIYLKSSAYQQRFTKQAFTDLFASIVAEDTEVTL
jgi:hypothetical protein